MRPKWPLSIFDLNLLSVGAAEKATEAGDKVFLTLVTGVNLALYKPGIWNSKILYLPVNFFASVLLCVLVPYHYLRICSCNFYYTLSNYSSNQFFAILYLELLQQLHQKTFTNTSPSLPAAIISYH